MVAAALMWMALATAQPQTNVPLQDVERRLGPFAIAGDSFTVVLHNKRLAAAETLATLEVQDRSGAAVYQTTFPYEPDGSKFKQVISASARLLPAENLTGLLLQYRKDPAPSGREESWEILRLRNGKLAALDLSAPTVPSGNGIIGTRILGSNRQPQPVPGNRGEMASLKVWTGNFYIFVPIRVDWLQGQITSGQRCFEMIAGAASETGCEMRVEAQRQPMNSDLGFVRLFREASENMGLPRHVVLNKDSTVEVVAARAVAQFEVTGDLIQTILSDVWLKVLIDNNEDNFGWIHTNEDFAAVGLPARSPAQ
jgi:hypothetical protein